MEGYWTNLLNQGNNNLPMDDNNLPTDDFSNPHEQQLPVVESTPSARPNQKRSKNFNEKEDALLVSAWLNVSLDPVQGTNQTRGTFWNRVYNYYHSNKDFASDRSENSLLHRWKGILENVNKFCGCIAQIELKNQSGVTFHDKLVEAMALFKAEDKDKKSFQFLHCWNILRTQPKWHEKRKQLATQKQLSNKKQKANTDSSPRTSIPIDVSVSNNAVTENGPAEVDVPKRPMGKKKAKEALRRGGGDASIEALDHLWAKKRESDAEKEQKKEERYNQSYTLEKERLDLEKRRFVAEETELQHKRMLDEERIMTMDTTSMPLSLQQFYKSLQNDIIARRVSTSPVDSI